MNRTQLVKHLGIASRGVSSKSPLKVLETVKWEQSNGVLSLSGTDTRIAVQSRFENGEEGEWSVCLPVKVNEWLATLVGEEVEVSVDGVKASFKCGRSRASFQGIDPDDFPVLPEPTEKAFVIDGGKLKTVLSGATTLVDANNSNPALQGIQLANTGILATTCGLSMNGICAYNFQVEDAQQDVSVILPVETANLLSGLVDGNVEVYKTGEKLAFVFGETTIWANTLDGRTPNYKSFVPTSPDVTASVNRKNLINAMKSARLFSSDDSMWVVKMKNTNGLMRVFAGVSENAGDSTVDVESPEDFYIATSSPKVIDVLSKLKGETVELGIMTRQVGNRFDGRILVTDCGDDSFVGVLMQMSFTKD